MRPKRQFLLIFAHRVVAQYVAFLDGRSVFDRIRGGPQFSPVIVRVWWDAVWTAPAS